MHFLIIWTFSTVLVVTLIGIPQHVTAETNAEPGLPENADLKSMPVVGSKITTTLSPKDYFLQHAKKSSKKGPKTTTAKAITTAKPTVTATSVKTAAPATTASPVTPAPPAKSAPPANRTPPAKHAPPAKHGPAGKHASPAKHVGAVKPAKPARSGPSGKPGSPTKNIKNHNTNINNKSHNNKNCKDPKNKCNSKIVETTTFLAEVTHSELIEETTLETQAAIAVSSITPLEFPIMEAKTKEELIARDTINGTAVEGSEPPKNI